MDVDIVYKELITVRITILECSLFYYISMKINIFAFLAQANCLPAFTFSKEVKCYAHFSLFVL